MSRLLRWLALAYLPLAARHLLIRAAAPPRPSSPSDGGRASSLLA